MVNDPYYGPPSQGYAPSQVPAHGGIPSHGGMPQPGAPHTEPPAMENRIPRPGIASVVMIIISIVLLSISIGLPWYQMEYEYSDDDIEVKETDEIDFDGVDIEAKGSGYGETYTDKERIDWDETNADEMEKVFEVTGYLIMLAIILSVIAIIFTALSIFRRLSINIGIVLTLICFTFSLIIPLYFAATLPEAFHEDEMDEYLDEILGIEYSGFIGSDSNSSDDPDSFEVTAKWGPSAGWYLSLGALILQVIALLILANGRGKFQPPLRRPAHEGNVYEDQYPQMEDPYRSAYPEYDQPPPPPPPLPPPPPPPPAGPGIY